MANKLWYKQIIDKINQCLRLKFRPILDCRTSNKIKIQTSKQQNLTLTRPIIFILSIPKSTDQIFIEKHL